MSPSPRTIPRSAPATPRRSWPRYRTSSSASCASAGRRTSLPHLEITRALRAIEERIVAVLAARIDQGRRDGDVSSDVDARATAEFLFNTNAGLRIMAKTNDARALYRIIDVALTTL
jgi:hypothetical protein